MEVHVYMFFLCGCVVGVIVKWSRITLRSMNCSKDKIWFRLTTYHLICRTRATKFVLLLPSCHPISKCVSPVSLSVYRSMTLCHSLCTSLWTSGYSILPYVHLSSPVVRYRVTESAATLYGTHGFDSWGN